MARTKELTEELLNMSLKDLLSMRNHLEDYVGMTVIPTIDLRILPSPGKKCGCRQVQTYEVIITLQQVSDSISENAIVSPLASVTVPLSATSSPPEYAMEASPDNAVRSRTSLSPEFSPPMIVSLLGPLTDIVSLVLAPRYRGAFGRVPPQASWQ